MRGRGAVAALLRGRDRGARGPARRASGGGRECRRLRHRRARPARARRAVRAAPRRRAAPAARAAGRPRPLAPRVEGGVGRLAPETLAVTASTPRLPGGAYWPGGIAAHAN